VFVRASQGDVLGDYRLQQTSPPIDAGVNAAPQIPTLDLDGAAEGSPVAAAGLGVPLQLVTFAALSVGALTLTRPALKRAAGKTAAIRTGVDAMQGRIGVVTRAIAELEPGQVKVGGETWTARCYYDEEAIPLGSRVEVVKVEGVTALVIPAPSPRGDSALEQGEPDG